MPNTKPSQPAGAAWEPTADDFRQAFAQAALGMALVDPGGRFLAVNRHLAEMLGYAPPELQGLYLPDLIVAEQREAVLAYWRDPGSRPRVVEQRCCWRHRLGHDLWVLLKSSQVRDGQGRLKHLACLFMDITQERRAERALAQSEQEYRTIFETAGNPMVIMAEDTTVVLVNGEFAKLTGVAKEQLEGRRSWTEFIAPGDVERMLAYHRQRRVEPGAVPRAYEAQVIDAQGQARDTLVTVALIPGTRRSVASLLDLSERKRAEAARALLAAAIAQASEGVIVCDSSGVVLYHNPAAERLGGWAAGAPDGHGLAEAGREAGRPWPAGLLAAVAAGEPWSGRFGRETASGKALMVEAGLSPVRDEAGRISHFALMLRDVTQEASLEAQLRQAQKMEALGTLAGGVAHDFNNILASILGYSEIVLNDILEEDHAARGPVGEVVIAARRARDLTRRILTFSRKVGEQRVPVDLAKVAHEVFRLVRASLPATIVMRLDLGRAPGRVMADSSQMHQVLLNLCTNAAQAMSPGGGALTVGLEGVALGPERRRGLEELAEGAYARLTVADTGRGMAEEELERIFDPYYTTKEPGQGTGLGLAVVHGIVRGHGGAVEVQSAPGRGSSFAVWLPLQEGAEAAPEAETIPVESGDERIMVVDDESGVGRMLGSMLGNLGYRVRVFDDPLAALVAFLADPAALDLVVSDQTMPGLSGGELCQRLLAVRPELPVILCSGYSGALNQGQLKALGARELLTKPVDRAELAAAVRRALAGKG